MIHLKELRLRTLHDSKCHPLYIPLIKLRFLCARWPLIYLQSCIHKRSCTLRLLEENKRFKLFTWISVWYKQLAICITIGIHYVTLTKIKSWFNESTEIISYSHASMYLRRKTKQIKGKKTDGLHVSESTFLCNAYHYFRIIHPNPKLKITF